jgi:hypothetical protein
MLLRMWSWLCLALSITAHAAEPLDFVPDVVPNTPALDMSRNGKVFTELATSLAYRKSHDTHPSGDLGLDGYFSRKLGNDWRTVLNARLDMDLAPSMGISKDNLSLTLRELYVSGIADGWGLDLGRINLRDGVALGFNPTDVFRSGALLARRTEDPSRLRESRLGVVGFRLNRNTEIGQFSALVAPRINSSQAPSWYDPRWGAVNGKHDQYYVKYTPPSWSGLYTNMVLHRAEGGAMTWGVNATDNWGQATVAFFEAARTRHPGLLDVALNDSSVQQWRNKFATGLTFATQSRQTLTLEYDYNGDGLNKADWNGAWQDASQGQLTRGFLTAGQRQDPLSRHSLMVMLQWEQLLGRNDDLSCLMRASLVDRSRFSWCEWTFRQTQCDWALNFTHFSGSERSEYGASEQRLVVGAKARFYF